MMYIWKYWCSSRLCVGS